MSKWIKALDKAGKKAAKKAAATKALTKYRLPKQSQEYEPDIFSFDKTKKVTSGVATDPTDPQYWINFFDEYELSQLSSINLTSDIEDLQNKANTLTPHATHYVVGGSGRELLIRTQPAKPGTKKGKTIGKLSIYDIVLVEEEFIGPHNEWHKIKWSVQGMNYYQPSYFVRTRVLQKLPNTAYSLNRAYRCRKNANYTLPDWTRMIDKEVFFDKKRCDYCIVVEPVSPQTKKKYTEVTTDNCKQALDEIKGYAMSKGLKELLKFYNKKMRIGTNGANITVQKILGAFQGTYIDADDGWYLSPRPRSKLKMLVRMPAKYFDALPMVPEDLRGIPRMI